MIVVLFFCGTRGFAQEKISLLSDYYYKRDAARYEEIKKETDPQKLTGMLIDFLKEPDTNTNPRKDRLINRLIPYISVDFQNAIAGYAGKKEWEKAISAAESLRAVLPAEKAIDQAVSSGDITVVDKNVDELKQQLRQAQQAMQQAALTAYYQSGNFAKAAEIQEQLYKAAPSLQGTQLLADIYLQMKNNDKYLENAKKIMAEIPVSQPQGFNVAYQSLLIYIQKNDMPAVTDLYKKLMDAYGDKLPQGVTDAQWNPERARGYSLLAQEAYANKDYRKALEMFEKVVKADPANGDAYYYIGLCKWQLDGQDSAIEPLAKSVVLNKASAARARQNLEQIHKANNNDSLDGLDEILAKAKASLGI